MSNVVPIRPIDWRSRVEYKQSRRGDSEIVNTLANAVTILRNDEDWRGVLAWDELSQGVVARIAPPWYFDPACIDDADGAYDAARPWTDTDGFRVQNWLQRKWSLTVSAETAYRAALMVAESNRVDPLRAWLLSLKHDGKPRVDTWLSRYFGAENTPYSRLVSRLFAIGSVARGLKPGCKMDTMLILEGPQGLFKSQGVKRLYGADWFRESPLDLHSNDRFMALRGCWCREWPELDGLGRADANRVKSFISPEYDDFRPPYGRGMIHAARRCVLVATVNPPQLGYLIDESGNRRMWPVTCGAIDLDGLTVDREQIWAEAVALYQAGAKWWPSTRDEHAECNQEQTARMAVEIWQGKISAWLDEGPRRGEGARVTIREALVECIGLPLKDCKASDSQRAGACLAREGWRVAGRLSTGERERYYERRAPEAAAPPVDDIEREAIAAESGVL